MADWQRSELRSSGALACELSTVVFACQAHDESLRGKSFLWCRHVTSFKANESYVHALRAEYFMPWRSLREKSCQKSHCFELGSCSTWESKELWSPKTCIQMQMLGRKGLLPPKHVPLSLCQPTVQQGAGVSPSHDPFRDHRHTQETYECYSKCFPILNCIYLCS